MDPSICMICSFSGPGLHRFPRDKKRLKDWLVAIERTDLLESELVCSIVYNSGRVCKAHFSDSCFVGKDKKKLLRKAVPTLSTAENKCSTSSKKASDSRKYRLCKKLPKSEKPSLSSPSKKSTTTGKEEPALEKYRACKKTSKNSVPRLSRPAKKKSTTKEKCSTTGKKVSHLRKFRFCKKVAKKSVPRVSNAVKRKCAAKKWRISENAQECNGSEDDKNTASEKSSYVKEEENESSNDIQKESSVNTEMETSDNKERDPSFDIEKESSINIKKEPLDNIENESSINIEMESLINIRNPSTQNELGAEVPNNQSITCDENRTKDVDVISPMKKVLEENIANVVSGKKEAEKIIGATKILGELLFLVKWKGAIEADLLPSPFVRKEFSELLIQFYEERLEWAPPPSGVRRN